jgi:cation transport ATPase
MWVGQGTISSTRLGVHKCNLLVLVNCRAYRRMIINFVWAFGYNVLAIPVAAGEEVQ